PLRARALYPTHDTPLPFRQRPAAREFIRAESSSVVISIGVGGIIRHNWCNRGIILRQRPRISSDNPILSLPGCCREYVDVERLGGFDVLPHCSGSIELHRWTLSRADCSERRHTLRLFRLSAPAITSSVQV